LSLASRAPAALAALLLTACGALGAGPAAPASQSSAHSTVKVALVESFSGPGAGAGRRASNGLQLEVDRLNAQGGLLGQRLEIVSADDESNPDKARELVREQLGDSRVKLLVGPDSGASLAAVEPLVRQANVPQCVTAVPDGSMAGAPVSFRAAPSESDRLGALFSYLRRGHPETGRIGLLDGGGQPVDPDETLLAQQAAGHGLGYTGRVAVGQSDADAAVAVQQLLAEGAQAALVGGSPDVAARAAAAIAAAGLRGQLELLGLDGVGDYSFPASAGDAAEGSVFAGTLQSYLTDQPEAGWPAGYRDFVHGVSRTYGYAAAGVQIQGSPAFADCIIQWSRAVQKAGTLAGSTVAGDWEKLGLPASETALGVPERASPSNHTTVPAEGVFVYAWVKSGSGYRLRQLDGPASP
jgi:branched-chain amino acid transport system substrate-binding protein